MATNRQEKISELYARATALVGGPGNMEKLSYLVFGGLTTAVNYAVFALVEALIGSDAGYLIANGVAWAAAVAFAFVVNKLFVFRSRSGGRRALLWELGSFLAARLASLIFDYGWMLLAVEALRMNTYLAKLLSNVVVVVMNYFFSKMFIFKKRGNTETTDADDTE